MAKTRLLDLVPEDLHEQLFKEVKEALREKNDPDIVKSTSDRAAKEVDADIEAWAKSRKQE